jgi:hypothetical protein
MRELPLAQCVREVRLRNAVKFERAVFGNEINNSGVLSTYNSRRNFIYNYPQVENAGPSGHEV